MPPFGPISRRDLVRNLHRLGFEGPYSGGKHQFMVRGEVTLRIPNPHHVSIVIGGQEVEVLSANGRSGRSKLKGTDHVGSVDRSGVRTR